MVEVCNRPRPRVVDRMARGVGDFRFIPDRRHIKPARVYLCEPVGERPRVFTGLIAFPLTTGS